MKLTSECFKGFAQVVSTIADLINPVWNCFILTLQYRLYGRSTQTVIWPKFVFYDYQPQQ